MTDENKRIFRDPRIDRAISWVLCLVVTIMLGIAATTYNDLRTQMSDLSVSVNNLSLAVALGEQRETVVTETKQMAIKNAEDIRSLLLWKAATTGKTD